MREPPVNRNVECGHQRADYRWCNGVARSVKTSSENVLRAPGEHSDRKVRECLARGEKIRSVHARVRKHQIHDRNALSDSQCRDRKQQEYQSFESRIQNAIQFLEFLLRI